MKRFKIGNICIKYNLMFFETEQEAKIYFDKYNLGAYGLSIIELHLDDVNTFVGDNWLKSESEYEEKLTSILMKQYSEEIALLMKQYLGKK
jgi:hypothetical protein